MSVIDTSTPEIQAAIALADAQLAHEQKARKIPGISAGIIYDQSLIWKHGYGFANLEQQIAPDEFSVYRCASITKLFTSTMMMILRDAGKLNLDDPLEKYVPEFRIRSPFADPRPPTFRMVAAHAAGLPREGAHEGWADLKMPTGDEMLASLLNSELHMPTHMEPKYSNLGISLLGYTLARIAGQPYNEMIKEHIFTPLAMNDSGFDREPYSVEHYAVGYSKQKEVFVPAPDWNPFGWIPAGGLYSTVADISKFMALQFTDAPAHATPSQILGSSTLREMHMPVNMTPDFTHGFGIAFALSRVAKQKVVGHSGSVPGFKTSIAMIPALKLGVVAFTNTNCDPIALTNKMLETLAPAFQHQIDEPPATTEEILSWKPYIGQYQWPMMDGILDIRVVDDHLTALAVGEEPSTYVMLKPAGEHVFKMIGGHSANEELRFTVDDSGKVTGLWFGGYPYQRLEGED
ncbi:MAG TPA: serine hydrolase domain-containing protein [Phototrophicaceae bacterium]|nr:serine hydrolase domain-containing protein [Phototrophicaceae bacterium]